MSAEHYAEEQQNEVDILQSIYPTEFVQESTDPYRFSLTIAVDDADDIRPCTLQLTIEYTPTYPDELPVFEIALSDEGNDAPITDLDAELSDDDIDHLTQRTRETGEESLGMAMVFAMASNLKEAAIERLAKKTADLKRIKDERIQKEIEAEQAKFIGTQVTRESFLEWKQRFEAEMMDMARLAAEAEERQGAKRAAAAAGSMAAGAKKDSRLTGRQLFEQDKSLAMSDSRFITDGDVSVDASAFAMAQQDE
ncbi:rwd domain-containing protein [Coemansia interrupta]|uniref:Rwd domain-containing protein n=1 Tax=Coemansia interrupta TaxID=1126814 RepID=A0A9W8H5S5_9FUNG|nr:rwd domain-containing protein [Coemansia interrupta]